MLANGVRNGRPARRLSVDCYRTWTNDLLELAANAQISAVDRRKLFGRVVRVGNVPFELVLEVHRADEDVELQEQAASPTAETPHRKRDLREQ